MINIVSEMLSYQFLQRALLVGTLISLVSSILGVSLVFKKYSMIGDGLSHVGFGTLAFASALNFAPLTISMPIVIIAAILLLRITESSKVKGDAAIAIISSGSLAIGITIMSMTTGMNTDVHNYLFGTILGISKTDTILSVVLSLVIFIIFILFYNRFFAITFDEVFAQATGTNTKTINMVIAILAALVIVIGMKIVGSLLISSLIVFPSLSSMKLFKNYKSVTISSALISVICLWIGMIISYIYSTPSGASVVICNIVVFILFWTIEKTKTQFNLKKS